MKTKTELEQDIKRLQNQIRCLSCKDCIELEGCDDGQVPIWDDLLQMWICGDMEVSDPHDPVTLNADVPTQNSANLVGQELQLVPATETTYGVIKLEDIVVHDEVTLNADDPTQESLNLVGQEIQVNPATNTEYGVVKLEDLSIHNPVTLNADQPTQDSANLSGQELQLTPATSTTYGVVKLEDLFAQFQRVDTYDDLPDPTLNPDEYYHVENSQGTSWLPGPLGGTYYSKGFYYSDGVSWVFVGEVPYQATQADVNAGIITDQFVSPATLNSATTVSHPGHTHVIADITDYSNDHGILTGLSDDDHIQYALLAGRATGQTLNGGNAANEDLILEGTAHGTKTTSYVLLQPSGGFVGIGNSSPTASLDITGVSAAGVTENIRLSSNVAGSTRDIRISSNTGALRMMASPNTLSAPSDAAAFQLWGNASGLPGQAYFDSGSHNSAFIDFRTAITAGTPTSRMRIFADGKISIGNTTASSDLTLQQTSGATSSNGFRFTGNSIGGTSSGTGFLFTLGYNAVGNKQIWFGDPDGAGNVSYNFVRLGVFGSGSLATLDAVAGNNSVRRKLQIGTAGDSNSGVYIGSILGVDGYVAIGNGYYTTAAPTNGLIVQGRVGFGTTAPDKVLEINLGTTDAFRLTYNDANGSATTFVDETISSTGLVTLTAAGSAPSFTFAQDVSVPDEAYGGSWDGSLEVPTKNALYDKIQTLSGGTGYTVVNVSTTPYTIVPTIGEYIYLVDATVGDITINLPTAVGNTAKYTFKKTDSSANTVIVDGDTTETIDGDLDATILFQYTAFTVISDNINWYRI